MPSRPTALSSALARIGDRWSLLLVEALMTGPLRFADLQDAVTGISTNVLSARLRHLEAERVVLAVPYSRRPLRYSYQLTAAGQDLAGAVRLLSQWSADHGPVGEVDPVAPGEGGPAAESASEGGRDNGGGTPRHALCGTPMVAVWWCPTCEQPDDTGPPEPVWV